jgi:hypothetical protein
VPSQASTASGAPDRFISYVWLTGDVFGGVVGFPAAQSSTHRPVERPLSATRHEPVSCASSLLTTLGIALSYVWLTGDVFGGVVGFPAAQQGWQNTLLTARELYIRAIPNVVNNELAQETGSWLGSWEADNPSENIASQPDIADETVRGPAGSRRLSIRAIPNVVNNELAQETGSWRVADNGRSTGRCVELETLGIDICASSLLTTLGIALMYNSRAVNKVFCHPCWAAGKPRMAKHFVDGTRVVHQSYPQRGQQRARAGDWLMDQT